MRKLNKRFYLTAGVITLIIFILGVFLGGVIEGERLNYIENKGEEEKINYDSLQLQYLYLSYLSTSERNESCSAFSATLNNYIKKTDETGTRLENYLEKGSIYTEEFELLKREYTISQLNYWILSKKTRELCGTDFVTVLYFHSKNCAECKNQGYILDYLKKLFGDSLLVFALDAEFDKEPTVSILKNTYNITETPTIVIEDKKFSGFISKDVLLNNICLSYREKPDMCNR